MASSIPINIGPDKKFLNTSLNKAIDDYNRTFSKRATLKIGIDDKKFRQPLGRITGDLKHFDSAIAASNARVLAFGASAAIIGGLVKSFKDLAVATILVEKNFADINRILNISNEQFEKFGRNLFNISRQTATGFQEATDAALEFARQGLSTSETLKRTADALTLVRLTGINAKKAVDSLKVYRVSVRLL